MKFSGAGVGRKIELTANVAIILVVVLIAIKILKPELLSPKAPPREPSISAGSKLALPGTGWSSHERTVVMVLKEGCRFCTSSAPFYQRLVKAAAKSPEVHLMAVLPQEIPQGKKYLDTLGVAVSDVQHEELASLKIAGTPTLLLIDRSGIVKNVWVGQLTAEGEADVLSKAGLVQKN